MSTELIWQTTSTGSADTTRLGELLGSKLSGGEVIELVSDLGGGKTTFTRGLAKGAGSEDTVSSPTFTLKNIYRGKKLDIYHYDFYRLGEAGIMRDELAEALSDKSAITVIEWGEVIKDVLPKKRISIELQPTAINPEERQITLTYPESSAGTIKAVETEYSSRP